MKFLLLIALFIPVLSFSQSIPSKPQSKIEELSAKSGVLLKKTYADVGKVKSVEFQILEITDMASKVTTKGLRIETPETGSYASGNARIFLDQDEVDGLAKVLQQFKEIILTQVPTSDVEYVFTSKAGFRAALYNYKNKWQFNVQIDKYNSRSQPYWDGTENLESVNEIILKVKDQLK